MARPDFEEIIRRYDKRLFNVMYAYIGNYHDALDITEEAFVRAFKTYANFRGDSDPFTWLYRIAVNVFKKRYLKESRRAELWSRHQEWEPPEEVDNRTPEASAIAAERAGLVREAIARLPIANKEVVTLRYIDGMSYEEIASTVGCSIGTVKSRLSRAKDMLAELLRDKV